MLGKIEGRRRRGRQRMRWHHRCNGHELGQTSGDGEGQGGLTCCSPWGHKGWDTTGPLNNNHRGRGVRGCYRHSGGRAEGAAKIVFTVHRAVSHTQDSSGPDVTSAKVEKYCRKL